MKALVTTYRNIEPYFAFHASTRKETAQALRAARLGRIPEEYLILSWIAALAVALGASVAALASLILFAHLPWIVDLTFGIGAGVVTFSLVRLGFLVYPRAVASGRRAEIEREFPSVALLCYALSQGGLTPLKVFKVVAEERNVYGEISREFEFVLRDVEWLGHDLNTALKNVSETTPSPLLKGYFSGLVTILNSGADPVDFFRRQTETQLDQAEMHLERELDHAGMLAEVYVSGLLVLPLLLIVLLSLLSALGNGGEKVVPLVVYLLIPGGTFFYCLILETLLPPDRLTMPEPRKQRFADFGIDSIPSDEPALPMQQRTTLRDLERRASLDNHGEAPMLKRRLVVEWFRKRSRESWTGFFQRAIVKPVDAIEVSGAAALLVFAIGGIAFLVLGDRGSALVISGTGLLLLAAAIALVPVSLFHELRVRRAKVVERAMPEMLGRLSGFNERGISLLRAFELLGRTSDGPLAKDLRALDQDVSWNSNLAAALTRLRLRVKTLAMTKLTILFERASAATGDLRQVLKIVASDTARTESLRSRRQGSMLTYVIVIYTVYAVFLYVTYIVTSLFYGEGGFSGVAGGSKGLDPETARVLFFQAVVIQGACCGLVAGKLGEGHILSGLKHAVILAGLGWAVFRMGVLG